MSRALTLLLFLAACGSKAADGPYSSTTRSMHLENGGQSCITFESKYAKGRIDIAGDVRLDYRNETTTTRAGATQRTRITIDDKVLDFDGPELLLGGVSRCRLEGEVAIRIDASGITVNGEKR